MKVENVKKSDKLPQICTFDVNFDKMGLVIRELRLMETSGLKWVATPSRTYESEGKKKYFSYIGMEKDRKTAFDAKCVELLAPFLAQLEAPSSQKFAVDDECPF